MAIPQEVSIGVAPEVTYKTYVAPTAFYEPTDENLDWDKITVQGAGLRVGKFTDYSDRRAVVGGQGMGDFTVECISKSMGKLFQACLGAGTGTLIAGSSYCQNFTPGNSPASLTIQKAMIEAGGTVDPFTMLGCMVTDWELAIPNMDKPTLKVTVDGGDYATATAYAAPSYVSSATLFSWNTAAFSTGTYTPGTTTTLATANTAMTNVRSLTLTGKNNMTADRFNSGGAGRKKQPILGKREYTGTVEIEYDAVTFRDAYLNDTQTTLIGKVTGATIGASTETLQVNLPAIKLEKGVPQANGDGLVIVQHDFTVLDDRSNPNVQIQYITLDATI